MKLGAIWKVYAALGFTALLAVFGSTACSDESNEPTTAPDATTPTQQEESEAPSYVGAWDITSLSSDGKTYDEDDLDALRTAGADFFVNLNEDGTALLCLGSDAYVLEGTYTEGSDGSLFLNWDNGSIYNMTIDGNRAKIGTTSLVKAGDSKQPPSDADLGKTAQGEANAEAQQEEAEPESQETETEPEPVAEEESEEQAADETEVSPDLKEFLDSYEAFMDEYVAFMQNYQESGDVTSMLMDYADMMQRYADFSQQISNLDTSNMSAADYAYYIEVTARVEQKLLSVL